MLAIHILYVETNLEAAACDRVLRVGGLRFDGLVWKLTQKQVINSLAMGRTVFQVNGEIVIVEGEEDASYITTSRDGERQIALLNLPSLAKILEQSEEVPESLILP